MLRCVQETDIIKDYPEGLPTFPGFSHKSIVYSLQFLL